MKMSYISIKINQFKISNTFALSNVNFDIAKGSICTLIGNNGSGKTSFLNLLVKNHKLSKDMIYLDKQDLADLSFKSLSKYLAYVPQNNLIYPEVSVIDFISMGRLPHTNFLGVLSRKDKAIIDDVIDELKITHLKQQTFGSLSGGQRQKVIIANALVQETPIIILDEPLNFLDLKASDEICELIKHLKYQFNKTIILVLHEIQIAANLADQLI